MKDERNPIGWTEIYVEDLVRAQKFYEDVLQITMQPAPVPQGMEAEEGSDDYFEMVFFPGNMEAPGVSGSLVKSKMFKPGSGGTMVYFSCSDCAEEISRVEAAGGQVIAGKMPIGEYGFCGICMDTEGNQIGFHSMQ
ncbi:VOC family protein [Desertivirga brevis]|uniref:VOC family protein n=1 Tax=Desertivirga brevis TaxID=2810310 RepID=UPI001A962062|nr:VOC family protein [Pedobacter sp. SYSU D00873]